MLKTHVMKMNTENTNCFIYEADESATADRLLIELLGGVRIEGLDRMRVTMKVSVVNRKHPQYTNANSLLESSEAFQKFNLSKVENLFSCLD